MAWARQRPDGGRGFGFTGGHDHWNWGDDDFRKLVLNAIVWTAKLDVPAEGVPSKHAHGRRADGQPGPRSRSPAISIRPASRSSSTKWNGEVNRHDQRRDT